MLKIGDYEVLEDFRFAGGGRCEWTFARKAGTTYFLKRFLSPKQVVSGAPGGAATIRARRARCDAFEGRQGRLLTALGGKSATGGNLIAPIDFFSCDGHYYKVTEKVDAKGIDAAKVHRLPRANKEMILRSAASSIRILHSSKIVHGDIKVDNIIIRDRSGGTTTASIIDFDDSYFSSEPPRPPEEFTFDPQYASPEVFRFISRPSRDTALALTTASDVFSLGIVFCEYLFGAKPTVDGGRGRYLGETLVSGGVLCLPASEDWPEARTTLMAMLHSDPKQRPPMKTVLDSLKPGSASSASSKHGGTLRTTTDARATSRVIINMRGRSDTTPPTAASPRRSSLRGTLAPKDPS